MTKPEAIRLALNVLRPFAEAGNIYEDCKADENFTEEEYEEMLEILSHESVAGPWSVFYEAEGSIFRIGPFDSQNNALQAARDAQATGEFDINDQQVYLIASDHRMIVLSEDDVESGAL